MILLLVGCVQGYGDWVERSQVRGPFIAISAARDRTCALGTNGVGGDEGWLVCWGFDQDHLLETATRRRGSVLALGGQTACVGGVDGFGCWGNDVLLDSGTESPVEVRALGITRESSALEPLRVCVATDSTTVCYGDQAEAVYGTFEGTYDQLAVTGENLYAVRDGAFFQQVLVAESTTTETMGEFGSADAVSAFGSALVKLVDGDAEVQGAPHVEDFPGPWIAADIADDRLCLTDGGDIQCHGRGGEFTLPGSYVAVATGTSHVCGITTAGCIVCDGDDRYGQSGEPPCE